MTVDTEVLVVGGGATGVGVARDLALRGVDVALIDRGGLSSGTTGRSHGLLHSGARYADTDATGAEECIAENRILRSIAGDCVADTGGLFVQLAADDSDYFERKREACDSVGIPAEVIDGDAARDLVPDLSIDVERAMRVPDAVVYPSRLVAANAADARDHGAAIHPNAPLEDLSVEDGRVTAAHVGGAVDDVVEPDYVVNAAGAWAGEVATMAGIDVEMEPTRGVMISVAYEGLTPVLNRARAPADGDIVVPHDSEVVLGTTSVPVSDPDEYERDRAEVEATIEQCAAMLPPAAAAPTVREWWGVRPLYAPDEASHEERGISRGFFRLDHADVGVENTVSIVGGKLTTYRRMAESTTDLVCDRLGVDAPCETADRPLLGADDADRLDEFVAAFGGGPSDSDVVSQPRR